MMIVYRLRGLCFFLMATGFCFSSECPDLESFLKDHTGHIAEAADNEERRRRIVGQINKLGLQAEEVSYQTKGGGRNFSGTNILVSFGGAETGKTIMLGAHYDRVNVGTGAVDNGASCAVLLWLCRQLKQNPLQNRRVVLAFWDQEELGLVGSREWVKSQAGNLPAVYLNLDIFGYGDGFWIMSKDQKGPASKALEEASAENQLPITVTDQQPPSDYLNFLKPGVETLGISLIDQSEIDPVMKLVRDRQRPAVMPPILTIIHTPGDTMEHLNTSQMARGVRVLERTLRLLD